LGPSRTCISALGMTELVSARPKVEHAPAAAALSSRTKRSSEPDGRSAIRERRRFVTAAQNRVVQVGWVGFSGIKRYDYSFTLCVYPDVPHSRDAHERSSQFADAFIAIFAFCRDRDSLQHRFVWAVQIMRVGWIEMLRIKWFEHASIYASGRAARAVVSC